MDDRAALRLALELVYVPWRVRVVRKQPIPEGMPLLLGVAVGDPASERAAAEATGRSPKVVKQAATFFIEQILLSPDADSYRVLGASPAATNHELRRNLALLMRWLHPDIARQGQQSIFAARIATAWNDLKTPERRTAYDNERQRASISGDPNPERRSALGEGPDRAWRLANREPHSRSRRSRRVVASREPRASSLPRVLAFLLGRPRR